VGALGDAARVGDGGAGGREDDSGAGPAAPAVRIAALGPVTAEKAKALGFEVAVVAPDATIDSLIDVLVERFGRQGRVS